MRGLPSLLLLFRKEFNKFSKTGARMLGYIYYMTLNLICKQVFWYENVNILPNIRDIVIDVIS